MTVDIQALIFDLDGVITDTAEYQYLSWKRLADEEGVPFTREDNDALRGVNRRESLRRLLKGQTISDQQAQEWMERKNRYYLEYVAEFTPERHTLPGVRAMLEDAKSRGVKLGVASASKNVYPVLEKLDLLRLFDVVGDATSVPNPKPAPDLFVWIAGYLRAAIQSTLVFEDSEDGINAAKQAGFWTVGLGAASAEQAHLALQNLEGLTVATLADRLDSHPKL